MSTATAASTGNMTWAVAVLDVNSVRNVSVKATDATIRTGGSYDRPDNLLPTHWDNPLSVKPCARANSLWLRGVSGGPCTRTRGTEN